MAKGNEVQVSANNVSLIGAGTEIVGEVKCANDLRVDGTVKGNLQVKGKLVVGNAGRVEGEVECSNGDISGVLSGKIAVQELLLLKGSSKFTGDIITKRLSIEPGSVFNGTCAMGEAGAKNSSANTPSPRRED